MLIIELKAIKTTRKILIGECNNYVHHVLTITPQDIVEVIEEVYVGGVHVAAVRMLGTCRVVETDSVPALIAAALADLEGEELHAHNRKRVVDDQNEEGYAE